MSELTKTSTRIMGFNTRAPRTVGFSSAAKAPTFVPSHDDRIDTKIMVIEQDHLFELAPSFLADFAKREPNWGFEMLSYVTYKRTYALELDEETGKSEEWWQTCQRVVEGTFTIQKYHCKRNGLFWDEARAQRTAMDMYARMFEFKWLPPGRGLSKMGTQVVYDRGGACLNNCGFASTKDIKQDFARPFCWAFDMSMLGVGVGFDTRGAGTMTPTVPKTTDEAFVVEDSREGWVDLLRMLLGAFSGKNHLPREVDYSNIRPKGAKIKTFGGTASGPDPLKEMYGTIHDYLMDSAKASKPIDSTMIVDLMNITGKCVVSGGVRRTAQLCLGNHDDEAYLDLKLDKDKLFAWRWASNNTVMCVDGMDYQAPAKRTGENGEPGYAWMDNVRGFGRMKDPANHADHRVLGMNPCITEDALIDTAQGPRFVRDLMGSGFDVVIDGEEHSTTDKGFFRTGHKAVYLLKTKEGHSIKLTLDHQVLSCPKMTQKKRYESWVEAGDLVPGDRIIMNNTMRTSWEGEGTYEEGWLMGMTLGDGHFHTNGDTQSAKLEFWGDQGKGLFLHAQKCMNAVSSNGYSAQRTGYEVSSSEKVGFGSTEVFNMMTERYFDDKKQWRNDAILAASSEVQRGFIQGMFDADGTVYGSQDKGAALRLTQTDMTTLTMVQSMLANFGILSTIYSDRRKEGLRSLPDGKGGQADYFCQATHELHLSGANLVRFHDVIDFSCREKSMRLASIVSSYKNSPDRERFVATVESLTFVGMEDVFDCTVPGPHRFGANHITVHNCAEQSLEDFELCCLVETFPAHHDSLEDYLETLKVAYLYAKTVTLVPTHSMTTNQIMQRNRRIGCSMSGIMQSIHKRGLRGHLDLCDEGYGHLKALDATYSDWLCVPRSIKISSVKPSGTVSLLAGATPGIHPAHAEHYIRRIRIADTSPLVAICEGCGYEVEDDEYAANTKVIAFPIKERNFSKGKDDVTLQEQFELAALHQHYWADNQVSCTATFTAEESHKIAWLLEAYEHRLKAISMLPLSDHGYVQAPYETIKEEKWEEMYAKIDHAKMSGLMSGNDVIRRDSVDKFCDGESCMVSLPE